MSRSRSRERRDGARRRGADRSGGRSGGRRTPDRDEWDDNDENAPIPKDFERGMVAIVTSRPGLPNNMIIKDCPLQINFIQRLLSNNRDCWTHGKSLYVTIAPGITVPINCYLRSSQKKIAKLSPGRQLAALEGFRPEQLNNIGGVVRRPTGGLVWPNGVPVRRRQQQCKSLDRPIRLPRRAVTGCENVLSPRSRRREVRSLRADRPRGESGGDRQAAA